MDVQADQRRSLSSELRKFQTPRTRTQQASCGDKDIPGLLRSVWSNLVVKAMCMHALLEGPFSRTNRKLRSKVLLCFFVRL